MGRWIFNIICGLSLLLGVFVAGMWVRSWWRYDSIALIGSNREIVFQSSRSRVVALTSHPQEGQIAFEERGLILGVREAVDIEAAWTSPAIFLGTVHFGFGLGSRDGYRDYQGLVIVPHWFLLALCTPLPALWFRGYRQRRRARYGREHGLCPSCGYDLRASVDRCPECGAAVESA